MAGQVNEGLRAIFAHHPAATDVEPEPGQVIVHEIEPEPFAVPEGWTFAGLGRCRSCNQPIAWCYTARGKRAPIDRDGTNHFATCPDADAWRRRGRRS